MRRENKKLEEFYKEQRRLLKLKLKEQRRRWYLHSVLKGAVRIRPKLRIIYFEQGEIDNWTYKQVKAFAELQVKFKYVAQHVIRIK